jgi:hypothetical protein
MESTGKEQAAGLNPASKETSTSTAVPEIPEGAATSPTSDRTSPPAAAIAATVDDIIVVSLESFGVQLYLVQLLMVVSLRMMI